ncbi:unnamed protein product [marine sediment metagenome]|uniref:Uncharacterized protein n=1 Tax=marine sediment metagenome TaxID=412755 RepID=X1P7Q3_9ZZZZ
MAKLTEVEEHKLTKEMCLIYWRALIPMYLAFWILDRLISIIYKSSYVPYMHFPPYFPLWANAGVLSMAFGLAWTWFFWKYGIPAWAKALLVIFWIGVVAGFTWLFESSEHILAMHGTTIWSIPVIAIISLAILYGAFVLTTMAKTLVPKLAVILGYIGFFVIIHAIYSPMFHPSWTDSLVGVETVAIPFSQLLTSEFVGPSTSMAFLGVACLIVMGWIHLDTIKWLREVEG